MVAKLAIPPGCAPVWGLPHPAHDATADTPWHNRSMTEALLVLYFVVLFATLIFKSRVVQGPWLFLLRAFFPNWKFFHAVGYVPHLHARCARRDESGQLQWTEWLSIYPRRKRRVIHLFHNADTNLGMGQQNLVDHFWSDLNDLPEGADPRQLVTYSMMERLVELELQAHHGAHTHLQFELRMVLDDVDGMKDCYTMLQSPVTACPGV